MPPHIQYARTAILGNAARGHTNRAGGKAIIRWSCNPPPDIRRTLAALAKLEGNAYVEGILRGAVSH